MNPETQMTLDLRSHLALNTDLLGHLERESQSLRQLESDRPTSAAEARRDILPRREEALQRIRNHRSYWLSLSPEVRSTKHEIRDLLRQNQDLIMRMILLDRENEQLLLRRGLIPPKHLPPIQRQRPQYVAGLYQRHHPSGSASQSTQDQTR